MTDHGQIEYRLRTCGELCTGLFSSAYPTTPGPLGDILKTRSFPSVDSADSDRKRILLGHIISTKSTGPLVTDAAMAFPDDWRNNYQLTPSTGHNEDGQTLCLHSLCVHPSFEGKGLGQILLRSYVQRIKESGVATRIALICRERLIPFYEKASASTAGATGMTWSLTSKGVYHRTMMTIERHVRHAMLNTNHERVALFQLTLAFS
jgi:GNAT superfamily N-acetyltransferase